MKVPADVPQELTLAAHANAIRLRRQFPMLDRDDIISEQYLWWYSHPRKVAEYLADEEHGFRKLSYALRNAALSWCHQEKARIVGYDLDDLFFYTVGMLRELLPFVIDKGAWDQLARTGDASGRSSTGGVVRDGMDVVACLLDVEAGLGRLSAESNRLIRVAAVYGFTDWDLVARELGLEKTVAYQRVRRALLRLRDELGGPKPDYDLGVCAERRDVDVPRDDAA